jgi:hypothetical protein
MNASEIAMLTLRTLDNCAGRVPPTGAVWSVLGPIFGIGLGREVEVGATSSLTARSASAVAIPIEPMGSVSRPLAPRIRISDSGRYLPGYAMRIYP